MIKCAAKPCPRVNPYPTDKAAFVKIPNFRPLHTPDVKRRTVRFQLSENVQKKDAANGSAFFYLIVEKSSADAKSARVILELGAFPVKNYAKGIQRIIGGKLITEAEDRIQNLVLGQLLPVDDLHDCFFQRQFIADTSGRRCGGP